jgi:hypothetical protein
MSLGIYMPHGEAFTSDRYQTGLGLKPLSSSMIIA